jgi:threonine dehydrogenase-like Zn-dependent dehydrogenase
MVEAGRLEVVEVDAPVPGEGQVLLDSYRTSICGSDLHLVFHGMYRGEPPAPPGWPGHESVGTVLESRADGFEPGDRVLAAPQPRFGRCFAERQVVAGGSLVHLPDGDDAGLHVLGQQLGTVVFAMRRFWPAFPAPGRGREPGTVAIFGAGAAGLLFTQLARLAGFDKILVSDLTRSRLDLASRFGATATVHAPGQSLAEAVLDETSGAGADLVIEAVGLDSTRIASLDAVRPEGRVGYFGYPETLSGESTWSFSRAWAKRISLEVSTGAQSEPGLLSFREAVRLIASGEVDTGPLAADVVPLARIHDGFEMAEERRGPKVSVELNPGA